MEMDAAALRKRLDTLIACVDPKCGSLCGRCLAALQEPYEAEAIPDVADDDPIRTHRKSDWVEGYWRKPVKG